MDQNHSIRFFLDLRTKSEFISLKIRYKFGSESKIILKKTPLKIQAIHWDNKKQELKPQVDPIIYEWISVLMSRRSDVSLTQ